jgi:hypothetical protein
VPFFKGQGIMPEGGDKNEPWWPEDMAFLDANAETISMLVLQEDCEAVGGRFHPFVHRERPRELFRPPLVVISQGFGKVAFCNFPILFQDSLQSISVASDELGEREQKADILRFLAAYLGSRLAKYYLFHTAANWGTERDKVHFFELLRLPFALPGDPFLNAHAADIVCKVAERMKALEHEIGAGLKKLHAERERQGWALESESFHERLTRFTQQRLEKVNALQLELENEVYRYFDLTSEEIALVEDTLAVAEESSTPANRDIVRRREIASLKTPKQPEIRRYARMLTETLNSWSVGGSLKVEASAAIADEEGLVLLTLAQTRHPRPCQFTTLDKKAHVALERIWNAARQDVGHFIYPRTATFFDGTRIHILKPATLGQWTRSAALNDADEIFASVVRARQQKKR